jgi:hypothetical protein
MAYLASLEIKWVTFPRTKQQVHDAMESLKKDNDLPADFHSTKILSNGDLVDANHSSIVYGNLFEYMH